MFKKLKKIRVFKDPIYNYIKVEYELISKLIDTKEFQRLRRIKQLSGVSFIFSTAEHSRFSHSLGVYFMAYLFLKEVEGLDESLDEYEKILFLISALLHDIGHGPLSHTFEEISNIEHEKITVKIIESRDSSINQILNSYNKNLVKDLKDIYLKKSKYYLIEQLISSFIDVDRLDYILRDSYFTGVEFGHIDIHKIFRSLIVVNKELFIKESSVSSFELYALTRYYMYIEVYYHPKAYAHDLLYICLLKELILVVNSGLIKDKVFDPLIKTINNEFIVDNYNMLDDSYIDYIINYIKINYSNISPTLDLLADRILNRKLFNVIDLNICEDYEKENRLIEYKVEYNFKTFNRSYDDKPLYILKSNGKKVDILDYPFLVNNSIKKIKRIYFLKNE